MKIYISGPMTGRPEFNFPAFHRAERELKALGWKVKNPARNFGGDQNRQYAEYLRKDIVDILTVDAIYMLHGWEASKGATLEHALAAALELKIFGDTISPFPKSILYEATMLVNGPRQSSYGHPLDDFTRTGKIWGAILKSADVPPETVGLMMVALKISREVNGHSRDNLVDMAGYAATIEKVIERKESLHPKEKALAGNGTQ